jgi:SAM-dependent methyltransferase
MEYSVRSTSLTVWYEDEAFWRDNYEVMFSHEVFGRAAEDIDPLLALSGNDPRRVLDLCCGPGRHTIPLAQKGLEVTGVDLSSFLLDKARENARAPHVTPEFIRADMRSFVRQNAFDAVLNLYTSFGYFENRDDDERGAHEHLPEPPSWRKGRYRRYRERATESAWRQSHQPVRRLHLRTTNSSGR